jgi:hypothetical protein
MVRPGKSKNGKRKRSSKFQGRSKSQAPKNVRRHERELEFEISLELEAWDLEL